MSVADGDAAYDAKFDENEEKEAWVLKVQQNDRSLKWLLIVVQVEEAQGGSITGDVPRRGRHTKWSWSKSQIWKVWKIAFSQSVKYLFKYLLMCNRTIGDLQMQYEILFSTGTEVWKASEPLRGMLTKTSLPITRRLSGSRILRSWRNEFCNKSRRIKRLKARCVVVATDKNGVLLLFYHMLTILHSLSTSSSETWHCVCQSVPRRLGSWSCASSLINGQTWALKFSL